MGLLGALRRPPTPPEVPEQGPRGTSAERKDDRLSLTGMALQLARRELAGHLKRSEETGAPVLDPRVLTQLLSRVIDLERIEDEEAPAPMGTEDEGEAWPGLVDMTDAELADLRALVRKARGG